MDKLPFYNKKYYGQNKKRILAARKAKKSSKKLSAERSFYYKSSRSLYFYVESGDYSSDLDNMVMPSSLKEEIFINLSLLWEEFVFAGQSYSILDEIVTVVVEKPGKSWILRSEESYGGGYRLVKMRVGMKCQALRSLPTAWPLESVRLLQKSPIQIGWALSWVGQQLKLNVLRLSQWAQKNFIQVYSINGGLFMSCQEYFRLTQLINEIPAQGVSVQARARRLEGMLRHGSAKYFEVVHGD